VIADNQMAEAVVDGLAGIAFVCECGKKHSDADVLRTQTWHGVVCQCRGRQQGGVTWKFHKKHGWVVAKRSLLSWRAREKQLLGEIAELEDALFELKSPKGKKHF
jgi:hypothetical protein